MVLVVAPNYTLNLVGLPTIAILLTLRLRSVTLALACPLIALGTVGASNGGKKAVEGGQT